MQVVLEQPLSRKISRSTVIPLRANVCVTVFVGMNLYTFSGPVSLQAVLQEYAAAQLVNPKVVPKTAPHARVVALVQGSTVQGGHVGVSVNAPEAPDLPSTTI